jgi:lipopolysaccharide/colanic/teichoic acid biosynthesis glycosyltransferase
MSPDGTNVSAEAFVAPRWVRTVEARKVWVSGRAYEIAKRAMDVGLVLLSAPLWGPAWLACAAALKASCWTGPILFRQPRTGRGGRRFLMLKFRTMVPNAEEIKKELAHLNELQWPDFKITNDPRVTRLGRFLRKTSLDELPQLLNVLRGEMSLVGPRPTSFEAGTYRLWQSERLDVAPGLTGLWQILGRGSTEFPERLRMDIAYIERRCLWMDVQILARTVWSVLRRRGAH